MLKKNGIIEWNFFSCKLFQILNIFRNDNFRLLSIMLLKQLALHLISVFNCKYLILHFRFYLIYTQLTA